MSQPPMIALTLELPEALAMLQARRESLRGKPDEESARRVETLDVAIARLVERIDAHNAAPETEPSADSSAA